MFSALGSREHTARKKMISNVYSKTHVQSSPAAAAQARHILYERLLPVLLRSMSKSQKPYGIDVYSLMMAAAMDFITAYIFGASNGTNFLLGRSERTHFLELYQSRNDYGIYDQELPRLTAWCRKLGIPLYPWFVDYANTELAAWNKKLCEKTSHFYETTGQDCASPLAGSADEPEVWQSLMKGMRKEKDTKGLHSALSATALTNPSLTVYSEITDHILAGHETTGIALTYLTWRLSQNPALQADLRHELLTLQPTACLTDGVHAPAALPDVRQLDGLPLLHAVLQETLRLHAPIPGAQPRQTPALFCALGPYAGIHAGVRVAATAYTLHRDERVFPDPEVWDPRRWLAAHATEDERRERNRQFWAFGSGGRMCIGSHFAMQGEQSFLLLSLLMAL